MSQDDLFAQKKQHRGEKQSILILCPGGHEYDEEMELVVGLVRKSESGAGAGAMPHVPACPLEAGCCYRVTIEHLGEFSQKQQAQARPPREQPAEEKQREQQSKQEPPAQHEFPPDRGPRRVSR